MKTKLAITCLAIRAANPGIGATVEKDRAEDEARDLQVAKNLDDQRRRRPEATIDSQGVGARQSAQVVK